MHYLCNACDNTSKGNKRKCRKCGTKDWLLVDDYGMVNIDLDLSEDEFQTLHALACAKYNSDSATHEQMQQCLQDLVVKIAEDIKNERSLQDD
jgi:hypothetical protein